MSMEILDCTLRDGGYINNWRFGRETIAAILEKLDQAGIDIIECGFLTREGGDRDCSLFSSLEAVEAVLPRQRRARYVAMIALGEKELEPSALPDNGGGVLQTVRSRCEELSLTPVPPGEAEEWLRARFPDRSEADLRRAVQEAQGILGRAVSLLEGDGGQAQERRAQADALVRALEGTDELALFEASLLLEKAPKEELPRLLDQLYLQLGRGSGIQPPLQNDLHFFALTTGRDRHSNSSCLK